MRNIGLYVDDQKIGTIGNGDMEEFTLPAGEHTIKAKLDWCGSNKHRFTISDNETYMVAVEPYKYANTLLVIEMGLLAVHIIAKFLYEINYIIWLLIPFFMASLYYTTFGYNRYLVIKEDKLSFSF